MRIATALALSLVALAVLVPTPVNGDVHNLLLIDGVPSERFIIMFHGEDGVIEAGLEGVLVAAAVGSSIAVVDSVKDAVVGVVNLSGVGWGRTVSLAWAGGKVVAVNASCSAAVISLGDEGARVEAVVRLGEGLRTAGAGGYVGGAALILCESATGPVLAVFNASNGLYRLVRVRGLISAGNPVFGRGPLTDAVTGGVYLSGVAPSGDGFMHGIYYLEPSELLGDEAVPHLLYGVESPSDWYLVGVRDVSGGEVLADVNGSLVLVDGDGGVRASMSLPWFYGDALFYRPTGLVAVTFRERYDVEWVAIYDLRTGLVRGLFMRGSVLRLAVASGKIYTLEPCVPGRDDYLALYSLAFRGLNELLSAGVKAEVSGPSVRVGVVDGLAPGDLYSWVSAYLDPGREWWEVVYTTHIHYNGSLYNTVTAIGEGGVGRAYLIDDLATEASPIPGTGVVMAGVLVEPPSYTRLRQWYLIDVASGKAITVLEVGADEVGGVQALSPGEWVSYGGEAVKLYIVSGSSVVFETLGPGVPLASPVHGSDYVVYTRSSRLFVARVGSEGLSVLYSLGVRRVLGMAYNPFDDSLLLTTVQGASAIATVLRLDGGGWYEDLLWPPSLIPIAPVGNGALALQVGNGSAAVVLASAMGRVKALAEMPSCSNPTPIDYFVSSGGIGAAVGCSSGAVIAWVGADSVPGPPPYIACAGAASAALLALLAAVRLAGRRHGGSRL